MIQIKNAAELEKMRKACAISAAALKAGGEATPTFALVNEYTAGNGDPIYHFDFYRIKKIDEVYDMG